MFKVTLSIPYLIAILMNLPGHLPNPVHAAAKRRPGELFRRRVNRGKVGKSSHVRARRTQELQQPGVRILTEAKILKKRTFFGSQSKRLAGLEYTQGSSNPVSGYYYFTEKTTHYGLRTLSCTTTESILIKNLIKILDLVNIFFPSVISSCELFCIRYNVAFPKYVEPFTIIYR